MSTTDATINVRVDRKTKEAARKTLEAIGLDLSSGVKLFLRSVVNTQSIPFNIKTQNGYTLEQEARLLAEAGHLRQQDIEGTAKRYSSAKEMIEDIDHWGSEGDYAPHSHNKKDIASL